MTTRPVSLGAPLQPDMHREACGDRCMDRIYASMSQRTQQRYAHYSEEESARLVNKCYQWALYGTLATMCSGTLLAISWGSRAAVALFATTTGLSGGCCLGCCAAYDTNLIPATLQRIERAASRAQERELQAPAEAHAAEDPARRDPSSSG